MRYFVQVGQESVTLDVEQGPHGSYRVRGADGQEVSVHSLSAHGGVHTLSVAGHVLEVQLREGEVKFVGERFSARAKSERQSVTAATVAGGERSARALLAPMPGRIVRVLCAPGQAVQKGSSLVVIEAMKMQNELCAQADQIVHAVLVAGDDTVDRGAVLVEFE